MPERLWPNGGSTTTPSGRTAVSVICRRPTTPRSAARHRNGAGRCAQSEASRPIPLQHRAWQAQMTNRLYSSLDERRSAGHRVKLFRLAFDTAVSSFSGRQQLYERYYSGDPVRLAGALYALYPRDEPIGRIHKMLDELE